MSSFAKAFAGPIFNVVVNPAAAYGLSYFVEQELSPRDISVIVAIDTAFRIALVHLLGYLTLPSDKVGSLGHLIFPCLTFLTQPLSVKFAERFSFVKPEPKTINPMLRLPNSRYLHLMAYIFFGWKINMMLKDVVYLSFPSLIPEK